MVRNDYGHIAFHQNDGLPFLIWSRPLIIKINLIKELIWDNILSFLKITLQLTLSREHESWWSCMKNIIMIANIS